MSREVVVAIEFGRDSISAQSRIGSQPGMELCWEAPPPPPGAASCCGTEEGDALVRDVLAVMHYPNVDTLLLSLHPDEVEPQRARLEAAYTGLHDLRNTECRSQRLAVNVRRVVVAAQDR